MATAGVRARICNPGARATADPADGRASVARATADPPDGRTSFAGATADPADGRPPIHLVGDLR